MGKKASGFGAFFKNLSKKQLIILISVAALLLVGGMVTAILLIKGPSALDAPVLTLNGDVASWTAVPDAEKYEISQNGSLSYVESAVTSKKLAVGDTFKVRAIGDGKKYLDSEWSNTVTYASKKYTITWKLGDTVLEVDDDVPEGTVPTYSGVTPTKEADDKYLYTFTGWTPEVKPASDDVTYTAVFSSTIKTFIVTWKVGDTVVETDVNVEYGTMPEYNGEAPKKAADIQYRYVFCGWSPALSGVVANVTYVAQFTSEPNVFSVVWKNGDTVLETDQNVPYGFAPTYDGAIPTKEPTEQYTYTFSGWSPKINNVTENAIYYATFDENVRKYTVKFYSEDGSVLLDEVKVEYGENAAYTKSNPTKNPTEGYNYLFDKWVNGEGVEDDLQNVVSDRNVYASFKSFVRPVTVYVVPNNSEYGTLSASVLNQIPYGSEIQVSGNTINIGGTVVTAEAKISTAQYTYTFESWTTGQTVVGDMTITANFVRTLNTYTVTWMSGGMVLEVDNNVKYGMTPTYNSEIPTKASEGGVDYIFGGWEQAISSVTGDVTYVAKFENASGKNVVIFYDDDGTTELGRVVVESGDDAVYPNALPTKEGTAQTAYLFGKWVTEKDGSTEAVLTNITESKVVYAKYETVTQTYTVTFCDYDGEVLYVTKVESGAAASAPGNPERSGFRFDGWDKPFNNVTADVQVTAKYVKQFAVEFLDFDNSIIAIRLVDVGGSAVAPSDPVRQNYRFVRWSTSLDNVLADLTVKAEYVRQYKVTFLDANGDVKKECLVDEGSSAVPPESPAKEGYDFAGWDKPYSEVTENLTVKATYKLKTYTVRFEMPDGTAIGRNYCVVCKEYYEKSDITDGKCPVCDGFIIIVTEQTVEHGFYATAPEPPELFASGSEVFTFTEWSCDFSNITSDLVVKAKYETVYTKPVMIVEFNKEQNGAAKLYIYNHITHLVINLYNNVVAQSLWDHKKCVRLIVVFLCTLFVITGSKVRYIPWVDREFYATSERCIIMLVSSICRNCPCRRTCICSLIGDVLVESSFVYSILESNTHECYSFSH